MAAQKQRKRLGFTMVGRTDARGRVQQLQGSRRKVQPERVIHLSEDARGTLLRVEADETDLAVSEGLDALIAASGGALIKLTPVGFADQWEGESHAARGAHIAVNVDHLTILPTQDKRGTVIRVTSAPRDIVVSETPEQIEALIDGD